MITLIVFLIFGIVIGFFLNVLLLKFASNLGIRNNNDAVIRWNEQSKPSIGGIPFFIVFLISGAVYAYLHGKESSLFEPELLGICISCTVAFFLGLSDDAYNTRPLLKLIMQIVCGILLINTGTFIHISQDAITNYVFTIFWIIAIMNSINMLDNMDGIATITSIFILVNMLILIYSQSLLFSADGTIIIGVLAALIAFLRFNWHPSKMFMGDTGSQFLGMFLAAFSIRYIWNFVPADGFISQTQQFVMVVLIFALPIIDTTTVTINRLRRNISPFVGGKDHTTHFLSYLGLSDSQIGTLFACISVITTIMILTITSSIENWSYLNSAVFLTYFVVLFIVLYSVTQIQRTKEKFNEISKTTNESSNLRVEFSDKRTDQKSKSA